LAFKPYILRDPRDLIVPNMSSDVISHYQVLGELGRGGMGVVYKASDTKLNRTVALKVLPQNVLTTQDDRARFYREARSAAALHHPNIATVFEIDEHEGQPFIAIEFVGGKSLQDRIAEGPLPLKEAVSIASQIAEGLKAAHAANIVHRDIKSANVMLTEDYKAKILDFGLAKTAASTKLTQMGSTLGTVAYMSPQQARGEDVDHRTDLWSLGAVLYEMISGKLPFPGDFEQAVVYSILNEEPKPLTSVRTGVPMGLEWIVSKLLAKDPENRYQSASDLLVDLRTVDLTSAGLSRVKPAATHSAAEKAQATTSERASASRVSLIGGLVAGAMLVGAMWALWPTDQPVFERSVKRFTLSLPTRGALASVDITPDGSRVIYTDAENTVDNVYVLDLATGESRLIPGTAGTFLVSVSPDGQWLLLTKDVSVDRVSMQGGTSLRVAIAQEGTPRADWGPGDWVVFENQQAIWKASITTGEAVPFTHRDSLAGEVDHDWPRMLPDGRTIVATIEYQNKPSAIGFWDFETGERKGQINLPGYRTRYAESGHLVFILGPTVGNLVALPFDLATLTATGTPIPILSDASTLIPCVSSGGTLITGGVGILNRSANIQVSRLATVTFPNITRFSDLGRDYYGEFELSPDGSKLVIEVNAGPHATDETNAATGKDTWVMDLKLGTKLQLTSDRSTRSPTWMPDGDSIAYLSFDASTTRASVSVRAADGSGNPRVLFDLTAYTLQVDIGASGQLAAYVIAQSELGATRLLVRNLRSGEVIDLTQRDDVRVLNPHLSPDEKYVAYERDGQVVVQSVDGKGIPIQVGLSGPPRWAADGTALFAAYDGVIFRQDVSLEPSFSYKPPSAPVVYGIGSFIDFDVQPDGNTGIVNFAIAAGDADPTQLTDSVAAIAVTVNWFETLK